MIARQDVRNGLRNFVVVSLSEFGDKAIFHHCRQPPFIVTSSDEPMSFTNPHARLPPRCRGFLLLSGASSANGLHNALIGMSIANFYLINYKTRAASRTGRAGTGSSAVIGRKMPSFTGTRAHVGTPGGAK